MTAKDQKLIDANPGKTAYELLALGLSQKAYTELSQQQEMQRTAPKYTPNNVLTPDKVELTPKHIAQPQLMPYTPALNTGLARIKNKGTGKIMNMNKERALKMARKYPKEFEVL